MRPWLALIVVIVLLLALPAQASGVDHWTIHATVDTDGQVRVSAQMVIHLDESTRELVIPLGQGARDLSVNGVSLGVKRVDGVPSAVLTREQGFSGSLQFDLTYTLSSCLDSQQNWDLVLPLLAEGMPYQVERISFTVILPAPTEASATFSSGYQQSDVDNYITHSVAGATITGTVETTLRDREYLVMNLPTDPAVYPRTGAIGQIQLPLTLGALGVWLLGAAYWFFFLRWKPVRTSRGLQSHEGLNPGFLGSQLLLKSPDLALLIMSWAQAGYVTIFMDEDMAVVLHKRMDMGNERSSFECDIFGRLFGKKRMVECSSRSFQNLRLRVDTSRPRVKRLFAGGGNLVFLRVLGAVSGALLWGAMADCLVPTGGARWVSLVLAALGGALVSWLGQDGFQSLFSQDRRPGLVALGSCGLGLALGIWAGQWGLGLIWIVTQQAMALVAVFGPRRSREGRDLVQTILSLHRHLWSMDSKQVNRMIQSDPGYYYAVAPYALALGVDKALARSFSRQQLEPCPWLITQLPPTGSSRRFCQILRQCVKSIRGRLPELPARSRRRR